MKEEGEVTTPLAGWVSPAKMEAKSDLPMPLRPTKPTRRLVMEQEIDWNSVSPLSNWWLISFNDAPSRPSYPEAQGLRHLAFKVSSVENSKTYLESHGIDVEEIRVDEITGKKFTFFADPDGLPLELYAL